MLSLSIGSVSIGDSLRHTIQVVGLGHPVLSALVLLLLLVLDLLLELILTDDRLLDLLGHFGVALRLLWVLLIFPI